MTRIEKISHKYLAENEQLQKSFGVGKRHMFFHKMRLIFLLVLFVFVLIFPWQNLIPELEEPFTYVLNYLTGIIFLVFLLVQFVSWFKDRFSILYLLTDRRILILKGFFATDVQSIDYFKITNVEIDENLPEKLLYKSATIRIRTDAESQHEYTLDRVDDYLNIQQTIYSNKKYIGYNNPTIQSSDTLTDINKDVSNQKPD